LLLLMRKLNRRIYSLSLLATLPLRFSLYPFLSLSSQSLTAFSFFLSLFPSFPLSLFPPFLPSSLPPFPPFLPSSLPPLPTPLSHISHPLPPQSHPPIHLLHPQPPCGKIPIKPSTLRRSHRIPPHLHISNYTPPLPRLDLTFHNLPITPQPTLKPRQHPPTRTPPTPASTPQHPIPTPLTLSVANGIPNEKEKKNPLPYPPLSNPTFPPRKTLLLEKSKGYANTD